MKLNIQKKYYKIHIKIKKKWKTVFWIRYELYEYQIILFELINILTIFYLFIYLTLFEFEWSCSFSIIIHIMRKVLQHKNLLLCFTCNLLLFLSQFIISDQHHSCLFFLSNSLQDFIVWSCFLCLIFILI